MVCIAWKEGEILILTGILYSSARLMMRWVDSRDFLGRRGACRYGLSSTFDVSP